MRKVFVSVFVWASVCSGAICQDQAGTRPTQSPAIPPELIKIFETENSVFGQFHLAPIIIPEGERVGDIIDVINATLIASADDCFPNLKPRQSSSQLPTIGISSEKELAAALGAGAIAEASGEVRAGRIFILDFQDVRVERVSLLQLRSALKKNVLECNSIRPFIDASYPSEATRLKGVKKRLVGAKTSIVLDKPPPLLIGMLFSARRVVHVRTTETLEGGAKLSFGAQLVKRLGLGSSFVASGSGGDNSANTVDLVGTNSVPFAFAPAFVVTATKQAANGQVKYQIASVNEKVVEKKIRFARKSQDGSIRLAAPAPRMRQLAGVRARVSRMPMPPLAGVQARVLQHALTEGHVGHVGAVGF